MNDILTTQLPPAVWSGPWPYVPAAAGRSDGMCRRGVVMHVTTRRRHPGGHPPSFIQVSATHTNAPHCVRTGDRQRHVQAVLGRNTSSEARKHALGKLPMRSGSRHGAAHPCESANPCIYKISHIAPVDESLPLAETFCGKLSHVGFISLYALHITQLSTLAFPSAPSVPFML